MFGIGTDLKNGQLARNEYEKYGNLLDHDILRSMSNKSDSAFRYGNVQVRFKKDKVLVTFTPEDSLNTGYQPTLCSDPKACSYDDSSYMIPKGHTSVSSFTDWRKKHTGLYLELQYHGNLTPDCVESITFPYDVTVSKYYDVALRWQDKGAKVYFVKDKKLYQLK